MSEQTFLKSKGLFQGSSSAPFLFILAVEFGVWNKFQLKSEEMQWGIGMGDG